MGQQLNQISSINSIEFQHLIFNNIGQLVGHDHNQACDRIVQLGNHGNRTPPEIFEPFFSSVLEDLQTLREENWDPFSGI